jgi:hypothetical protein
VSCFLCGLWVLMVACWCHGVSACAETSFTMCVEGVPVDKPAGPEGVLYTVAVKNTTL